MRGITNVASTRKGWKTKPKVDEGQRRPRASEKIDNKDAEISDVIKSCRKRQEGGEQS